MKIIIMAGGSGTRLWPLSRTYFPKQFVKLLGMEKSILQMTIERSLLMGSIDDIYIVTSRDYIKMVQEQIAEIGQNLPSDQILLEPEAKNTLPAILYAVQAIQKKGDDICAVFASDHVINRPQKLADIMLAAKPLAEKGFVCFGIEPQNPETGFGYIKPGEKTEDIKNGFVIAEFKEKPDYDTACKFVKEGYLWNSGIFMFKSDQFTEAVKKYNPPVYEAFEETEPEEKFKKTPKVSVDYGLIEKMDKLYGMPIDIEWNDLGSFISFYDRYNAKKDEHDNIYFNDEIMLDSERNFVYSEGKKVIAMVGVSDVVVIEQNDALLICKRDKAPMVKDVAQILKERKDKRVDYHS